MRDNDDAALLRKELADLKAALKHEREISAAERRRAVMLEEATRRAFRLAADVRPRTRDHAPQKGVE